MAAGCRLRRTPDRDGGVRRAPAATRPARRRRMAAAARRRGRRGAGRDARPTRSRHRSTVRRGTDRYRHPGGPRSMELTNDFRVAVSPSTAWMVLTDVERIAPCMPGAQLQEIEGDEYRGVVKVKVGP